MNERRVSVRKPSEIAEKLLMLEMNGLIDGSEEDEKGMGRIESLRWALGLEDQLPKVEGGSQVIDVRPRVIGIHQETDTEFNADSELAESILGVD